VVHHGRALGQGHYTAYALVHENWYHFDDERVKLVGDSDAQAAAGQASILCFTRRRQRVSSYGPSC
jgi:ubiquitin C-terminal hydrolase